MRLKTNILIIIAAVFAFITTANAQSITKPMGDRNTEGFNLAMMGGGGMGGGGMMGGSGNFNGYGWPQQNGPDSRREYQQPMNRDNQSVRKEEIQKLHEKIEQERRELSSLYRSGTANESEINRKTNELNNLERDLDDKISNYDR